MIHTLPYDQFHGETNEIADKKDTFMTQIQGKLFSDIQ